MSSIKNDASFKAPVDANPLSSAFDDNNGDFDTPEEFIRAYLNNDTRALAAMDTQNMEQLRDALERISPEIADRMRARTDTAEDMQCCLDALSQKPG